MKPLTSFLAGCVLLVAYCVWADERDHRRRYVAAAGDPWRDKDGLFRTKGYRPHE